MGNQESHYASQVDLYFERLISEVVDYQNQKEPRIDEPGAFNEGFAYQSVSLRMRAFKLFDQGEFKSDEMDLLVKFFGRPRLVKLYKLWQKEKKT